MRTFEELSEAVRAAMDINDATTLEACAAELELFDTDEASATAAIARGTVHRLRGDYQQALKHFRRALQIREDLGDLTGIARVTNNMGMVCQHTGDFPQALLYFRRALQICEELDDSAGVARATGNMGMVYASIGDYPQALEKYRRALQMHGELGNRAGMAIVTSNMGSVYANTGDFPQALELFRRALQVHEVLGDRVGVARATNNMGNVYRSTGDYPQALEYYRRALRIHEELGNRAGVADVTGNLGMVYRSTGDYPQALELYRRALQMREELGNRAGAARVTGNMGTVYADTGDYSQALEHYRRALQMHEELGNRAGVAHVMGKIGNVYSYTGDDPQALEYYRLALQMHEELGAHANIADVTGNVVTTLLELNLDEEAEGLLHRQSLMKMSNPETRAQHHAQRAVLAERRGELDAAWEYLQQALKIVAEVGARNSAADYHKTLRDLAQKRNDFAAYIEHNNAYQQITDEVHGKEATQKLAMLEADKRIAAERAETEKHKALLYNTLPPSIADRVLRGEVVNDTIDMAAVLFMDLVGFTTMSSTMDPGDVVTLLSSIFSTCDAIMAKHGLMKIKTIGDSYMAVSLPTESSSSQQQAASVAQRAANAALEMLDAASHIVSPTGSPIEVRLGVHCGAVTAGVIGTERLQYDVWGDTVNVASRMESTGEPGRIHVSEAFASFLATARNDSSSPIRSEGDPVIPRAKPEEPGTWHLALRGEIEIKGKGRMTTFWLQGQ